MKLRFLFALLLCCACSSSEQAQNRLYFNLAGEPETTNPQEGHDLRSAVLSRMLYEGLTRMDKHGSPQPALAESIDVSPDGRRYRFHLRPSLWSDGEALVADDFIAAWKRAVAPDSTAANAEFLYVIKNAQNIKHRLASMDSLGAHAVDVDTIEVELEYPDPNFLQLVSLPIYFPLPRHEEEPCNGPFCVQEWRHDDAMILVRNPHYWDRDKVKLKEIELSMVDPQTEVLLYEDGKLHWCGSPLGGLPTEALPHYEEEKRLNVMAAAATEFFRFNTQCDAFAHPKVRQAFSYALRRKEIVQHVTQGGQIPATSLIPPLATWKSQALFKDGDAEKAKQLLVEALNEMGLEELPPITLMYSKADWKHKLAQTAQQQWQETLGVRVQLQSYEWKVFLDKLKRVDYQVSMSNWFADLPDAMNFLEIFQDQYGANNRTKWGNVSYSDLVSKAKLSQDAKERQWLLTKAEEILIAEMPIAPLYYYSFAYMKTGVKDVVFSELGFVDFKEASVE